MQYETHRQSISRWTVILCYNLSTTGRRHMKSKCAIGQHLSSARLLPLHWSHSPLLLTCCFACRTRHAFHQLTLGFPQHISGTARHDAAQSVPTQRRSRAAGGRAAGASTEGATPLPHIYTTPLVSCNRGAMHSGKTPNSCGCPCRIAPQSWFANACFLADMTASHITAGAALEVLDLSIFQPNEACVDTGAVDCIWGLIALRGDKLLHGLESVDL